jgi:hypothetical protein
VTPLLGHALYLTYYPEIHVDAFADDSFVNARRVGGYGLSQHSGLNKRRRWCVMRTVGTPQLDGYAVKQRHAST